MLLLELATTTTQSTPATPSAWFQDIGIWAAIIAALGVIVGAIGWLVSSARSRWRAWSIDYVDANLAGSLGKMLQIPAGATTVVRIRIRVNIARSIAFEELAIHPRQVYGRKRFRPWLFELPEENITDVIRIADLGDPEADTWEIEHRGQAWVRRFQSVPSRDHRGIWRGFFIPPYVRGKHEPLFIRVDLYASRPWHGYLFVRLINDRSERVFHALNLVVRPQR